MEMAEADAVIPEAAMGVALTGPGDGDLSRRRFQVDAADDVAVPIGIIHAEKLRMKLDRRGRFSLGDLGAPLQAGAAAPAQDLLIHDDAPRVLFVPLAHAVHAGVHAGSAVEAEVFVDGHPVARKGLALLLNLLVEARPDHFQKMMKFGAGFHVLDELGHLAERKIDIGREMLFQALQKGPGVSDGPGILHRSGRSGGRSKGAGS